MPDKSPRRERTPLLLVRLPRCPHCHAIKLRCYKRRNYRAFEIRYCHCVTCGKNVNLRVEWPFDR